jgi:hypothetical protein
MLRGGQSAANNLHSVVVMSEVERRGVTAGFVLAMVRGKKGLVTRHFGRLKDRSWEQEKKSTAAGKRLRRQLG